MEAKPLLPPLTTPDYPELSASRIRTLDRLFANAVKNRVGYRCERCGWRTTPNDGRLQCAHFFSRKVIGIRWNMFNGISLCQDCHLFFGRNGTNFLEWYVRQRSPWRGLLVLETLLKQFHSAENWAQTARTLRECGDCLPDEPYGLGERPDKSGLLTLVRLGIDFHVFGSAVKRTTHEG
jgi:hypothetical protein